MHLNKFATRLKEERMRLELSQDAMAELGGVKKLAQFNYEKGERSPTVEYLDRLHAVGVDVAYLLTGCRARPSELSPEQTVLLASLDSADDAGRAALLAVAAVVSPGKAGRR